LSPTMKTQVPLWVRYILPAWVIGITVTLALVTLLGSGVQSRLLLAILRPALILVELMGYGGGVHNWRVSILVAIVGGIFYGAIVFVIMLLVRKR
jgi:uncharacterized membrane protein